MVVEYKVLPESVGEVDLGVEDLKTDLRFQRIVTSRIRCGIQASRMAKKSLLFDVRSNMGLSHDSAVLRYRLTNCTSPCVPWSCWLAAQRGRSSHGIRLLLSILNLHHHHHHQPTSHQHHPAQHITHHPTFLAALAASRDAQYLSPFSRETPLLSPAPAVRAPSASAQKCPGSSTRMEMPARWVHVRAHCYVIGWPSREVGRAGRPHCFHRGAPWPSCCDGEGKS